MSKEIWIAEIFDFDSYERMGFFDSDYKAFIACLKDYKKYKNERMPHIKKREFSDWKWHRNEVIKRLSKYEIHTIEVR